MSKITIELTERGARMLLERRHALNDVRLENQIAAQIATAFEQKQEAAEESLRVTVMRRRSVVESLKRIL